LVIRSSEGTFSDARIADLPELLLPGDLLIVNDAATLPASLPARSPSGRAMEIRLARQCGGDLWQAVLFGPGDWRTPTELRDPPEKLTPGAAIEIRPDFVAEVLEVSPLSDRLVTLRFNRTGASFWAALYAHGRPVQYSYHLEDVPLWSVQTVYAARPWSMEMPSAGRPLTWSVLLALKRRGIKLASLTHSAGLSSVGDEDLDANLPLTERFDIPQATIDAIEEARGRRARVIAVGTTVVRALEGGNLGEGLRPGLGQTDLVIGRSFHPQIVNGILTGVHDPAQSHFRLLRAFADETTLRRAWRHATEADYLCHEFGDLCLIF
jgi:S-adenosylmethionine:tRNA ribosyltransferase-isomerase